MWAVALAACQPWVRPVDEVCLSEPPGRGEVRVVQMSCEAQQLGGGEGQTGDWQLANSNVAVVLRSLLDAQTLRVGGLTVLDAAPWGSVDRIHEAVPIVGGGWLEVDHVAAIPNGLEVGGVVVDLFDDRPAHAAGERRQIRYVLRPDQPWLRLEGAEGLYLHVSGDAARYEHAVQSSGNIYGWDAGIVEDLGGAVIVDGATQLLIDDRSGGWAELAGEHGVRVSGTAPSAGTLVLLSGGEVAGRTAIVDGAFDTLVEPHIEAVRAEGTGRGASATVPIGEDLSLWLAAAGSLKITPYWPHRARPIDLVWTAMDGRSDRVLLDPLGGLLALGAGEYTLRFSAGSAIHPLETRVLVKNDVITVLPVRLQARFDPGSWVQLDLDRPSDRSRDWRGTDVRAAREAVGDGAVWAVFAPVDDVPGVSATDAFPDLRIQNGVTMRGDDWSVTTWPWRERAKRALHGGVQEPGLGPLDAAAAMTGGPDDNRWVRVDLGWLAQAGPPHIVDPRPDFVALGHPGPQGSAWAVWFAWLDARRAVVPTGPVVWVPVTDPDVVGDADVEQPLIKGNVSAGTGPLLKLSVDGLPPGEVVPTQSSTGDTGSTPRLYEVGLEVLGGESFDHVLLMGSGGRVIAEIRDPTHLLSLDPGWVVALAYSDAPDGDWAVSGPVWIDPVIQAP